MTEAFQRNPPADDAMAGSSSRARLAEPGAPAPRSDAGPSRRVVLSAALAACAPGLARADARYPERPVSIIVPFAAGGLADLVARLAAERLSTASGQRFIVDNRPGAGGNNGTLTVARAAPDGYTLGLVTETVLLVNPHIFRQQPFTVADLAPIGILASAPQVLVVNATAPARTLSDFVALAKSKPGSLTYGSSGPGTPPHLVVHQMTRMTGIDLVHVPYRSAAPGLTDLLAGRIDIMAVGAALVAEHLGGGGRLRALAVTAPTRVPDLPDIPTVVEAGVPDLVSKAWFGLVGPRATPPAIVERLNGWLSPPPSNDEERRRYAASYLDPTFTPASQMADLLKAEAPRWERIVRETGVKVD